MIYFFRLGSRGPIKIGVTRGPISVRLGNLASELGVDRAEIKILGVMAGLFQEEVAVHRLFSRHRCRPPWRSLRSREWYYPDPEIREFIRENAQPWDPATEWYAPWSPPKRWMKAWSRNFPSRPWCVSRRIAPCPTT